MIQDLLNDYGFWEKLIRQKKHEIERLRERKLSISIENDGLPRGTSRYTMEDYISDMESLEADLKELLRRQLAAYDIIFGLLVDLSQPRMREILYLRYIDLLSWKKIQKAVKLSRTRCFALHKEALEILEKKRVRDSQLGI